MLLPIAAGGRIVLAAGVLPGLRPDANTCADRSFCHTFGSEFIFGDPSTWGAEQAVTVTDTRRYGKVTAQAWVGCIRGEAAEWRGEQAGPAVVVGDRCPRRTV